MKNTIRRLNKLGRLRIFLLDVYNLYRRKKANKAILRSVDLILNSSPVSLMLNEPISMDDMSSLISSWELSRQDDVIRTHILYAAMINSLYLELVPDSQPCTQYAVDYINSIDKREWYIITLNNFQTFYGNNAGNLPEPSHAWLYWDLDLAVYFLYFTDNLVGKKLPVLQKFKARLLK